MEITKHKKTTMLTEDQKHIYKFVCPHCGCEFNCTIVELHTIERRLNGKITALCPECRTEVEYLHNQLV